MFDHTRIATNYDYETLLGEDYFLTVLQAMHDVGEIPNKLELAQSTIRIKRPSNVEILPSGDDADIGVTVAFEVVDSISADAFIKLKIKATKLRDKVILISSEFESLDDDTEVLLSSLNIPGVDVPREVHTWLQQNLDKEYRLGSGKVPVNKVKKRLLPAENEHLAALGLYINKKYKIAPPPRPPESGFNDHGDVILAVSFLEGDRTFAIGAPATTLQRLAAKTWHSWREQRDDGSFWHPLRIGGEVKGKMRSISIIPENDVIRVVIKAWYDGPIFFNADIKMVLEVRPRIGRNELIEVEIKLAEFDADTGFLGDLVGALLGALIGGILASSTGGLGIPVGVAIGAVGGTAFISIGEEVAEEIFEDEAREAGEAEKGIFDLFDSLPKRNTIGYTRPDPFFKLRFDVVHRYKETTVNQHGVSFGGITRIEPTPSPLDVMLVDKTRGSETGNFRGIESLLYRISDRDETEELAIQDVLARIPARRLKTANLIPKRIRRAQSVITEIQFDSGIILTIREAIALQERNVLRVVGCQLIRPRNTRPYLRSVPDSFPDNNLESLPSF